MNDCYDWLIHTPATDVNFQAVLKKATDDELNEARCEFIIRHEGNKTRRAAVEREIQHRRKARNQGGHHD